MSTISNNTAEQQRKKYNNRRIDILLALFLILAAGMSMFVLVWKEYVLSSYPAEPTYPANLTSPAAPTNPTSPTSPTTPTGNQEIDTTDWLTYRNEEYGFEFKYPKDMSSSLTMPPYMSSITISSEKELNPNSKFHDLHIIFDIQEKYNNTLEEFINKEVNVFQITRNQEIYNLNAVYNNIPEEPKALKVLTDKDKIIGYLTKYESDASKPGEYTHFLYTLTMDNYILRVMFNKPQALDIINTIAFFPGNKQIPIIDTADWLTYRNEEYGFEFKYPKEWETGLWERQDPYQVDIIMMFEKLADDPGYIMIRQEDNLKVNKPDNSPEFSSKEEREQYFREWNKKIYEEKYGFKTLEDWIGKDYINKYYKVQLKNTYIYADAPSKKEGITRFIFTNKRNQIFEFYWSQWEIDNKDTETYYQLPKLLETFTIF